MPSERRIHLHVYGLRNCDSSRHALKWLTSRRVLHTFHDLREDPVDDALLRDWLASSHAPYLVNRRSATWRKLPEDERQRADSDPVRLLGEHPTLIKRPVITDGDAILDVGFSPSNLEDSI